MNTQEKRKYDRSVEFLKGDRVKLTEFILHNGLWLNRSLKNIPNEKWLPVGISEGDYLVSSYGRIKSVGRIIYQSNGHPITLKEKIKRQAIDKDGYLYVSISGIIGNKNKKVHILVANAFKDNPKNKYTVNHENGVRCHNEEYNLNFATISENVKHGFDNGRLHPMLGKEGHLKGKTGVLHHLSKSVTCINNGETYESMSEAARLLNLKQGAISNVCYKKCKHTKGYVFEFKKLTMYYYICKFTNGGIESVTRSGTDGAVANQDKAASEKKYPDSLHELRGSQWLYEGDAKSIYDSLNGFSVNKECKEAHRIGDHIPQFPDLHLDGQTCNCGKILYVAEPCGCPGLPRMDLHAKENPNHKG